jgi:hypothetical protein
LAKFRTDFKNRFGSPRALFDSFFANNT